MAQVGVGLEIGGVGDHRPDADREREERLPQRDEHRRGRHFREIRSEKEFQSRFAARHQQRVDRQDNQDDEEQRHQDFGRTLDALLHAERDHEVGSQHEQTGVENRPPRIADEGFEEVFVLLGRRVAGDLARGGVYHVFGRPSRNHEIESQNQKCRQHAVVAQKTPSAVQLPVGAHRIEVRRPSHGEFRDHQRQPQQQYAEDVDDQKGSAAVVSGDVRKPPDVAQPHGAARRDEHGAQFATQRGATLLMMHNLTCLLSETGARMAHTRPISPARRSLSQAFRPAAAPVSIRCILHAVPARRRRKSLR